MKSGKDPGQVRQSVVPGDHEVEEVGLPPGLAPVEAHLGLQPRVPALAAAARAARHRQPPVQPPQIFGHLTHVLARSKRGNTVSNTIEEIVNLPRPGGRRQQRGLRP